jgi:hypothetical protein
VAWGLITQVAGGMIHLVLVAAAVELIKILLSGRQSMLSKIRARYFMGAQEIWLGSFGHDLLPDDGDKRHGPNAPEGY